jgi:glucose-6-phosphate 1-dehydrogenase
LPVSRSTSTRAASRPDPAEASGAAPAVGTASPAPQARPAPPDDASLPANPLRAGLTERRVPEPCTLVLFGASGDLVHRKIFPALYNLALDGLLPDRLAVVGVARRPMEDDAFRRSMEEAVGRYSRRRPLRADIWRDLARATTYLQGDFRDAGTFTRLGERLGALSAGGGPGRNCLYYLATPPSAYTVIVGGLRDAGLAGRRGELVQKRDADGDRSPGSPAGRGDGGGATAAPDRTSVAGPAAAGPGSLPWTRLVVEKPFGHDLTTARQLNGQLQEAFREDQVFRIDHYLGKETVQNLLVFRFANGIFEPVWNRQFVDHVQITVAESLGVEGRGGYYEESGAGRDMLQNHLLQLLSLVAMEPPAAFAADDVRGEKVKVLRALRPFSPQEAADSSIRAQYGPGFVAGRAVPAYREEPGVADRSNTETFVALRAFVDNWRWAGVPFYLRTGKRLPKQASEIVVQFRRAPHLPFRDSETPELEPNALVIRIQPDEGITLRVGAKVPGPAVRIRSVNLDFFYGTAFGEGEPEAYERLLLDCMLGEPTLFTRRDEVEAAWAFVDPLLAAWREGRVPLSQYEAGTWGPAQSDELMARDGRRWRRP